MATDLVRKRSAVKASVPILLSKDEHQREIVAACCQRAERAGVARGMTISQARALVPGMVVHKEAWDEGLISRAVRRLAARALRFSPRVAPDGLDGLWMDCAGCTHLHGGVRAMAASVADCFVRMEFACRIGVAPTMGAAWALSRFGRQALAVISTGEIAGALAPLPASAMRLELKDVEALKAVGVVTVGDLVKIPRGALAERFGGFVVRRVDQAMGREVETFTPISAPEPVRVSRMFAGPTDRPESIGACVRQLLRALCARLERRQNGCREVRVVLMRSDLDPVEVAARATRAVCDPARWYALVCPQLERAHLGFGVEGVEISASGIGVLRQVQARRWVDGGDQTRPDEAADLADTLTSRLSEACVLRMRARASHVPERSWTIEPAGTSVHKAASVPGMECAIGVDRPTLLLPQAAPIDVVFLFPDGPIGSVRWGGQQRRVIRSRGPERVCGEWWRHERTTRDYYRVHTEDGAWIWVYRVVETGRWFLHGEWA